MLPANLAIGVSSWLSYDSAVPASEVAPGVKFAGYDDLSMGLKRSATKQLPATQNPVCLDKTVYHPRVFSGYSMILDIQELMGFNLYRDTSPTPFDRGMKINRREITGIFFDDYGDDPYGPIVNGVTYYYQAFPYNINGALVEVGSSTQVVAFAEKHPPGPPVNLTGEVEGNTVKLYWDPNEDYDIESYNIYRRDPNEY